MFDIFILQHDFLSKYFINDISNGFWILRRKKHIHRCDLRLYRRLITFLSRNINLLLSTKFLFPLFFTFCIISSNWKVFVNVWKVFLCYYISLNLPFKKPLLATLQNKLSYFPFSCFGKLMNHLTNSIKIKEMLFKVFCVNNIILEFA